MNPLNVGFELSFMDSSIPFKIDEEGYLNYDEKEERILEKKCIKINNTSSLYVHNDMFGTFEIDSPVFDNKDKAVKYYKKVVKTMTQRFKLSTHSKKCDGGGLHFHIDMPSSAYLYHYTNIAWGINSLPYLNWIFNNPVDVWNGNNAYLNVINDFPAIKGISYHNVQLMALNAFNGDKSSAVRFEDRGTNRVEYRFFDMPYNEKEFGHLYEFIIRLHDKMIERSYYIGSGRIEDYQIPDIINWSQDNIIKKFEELLKTLRLDFKDYEVFIKRNLSKRYSYGKEYLV